MEERVVDQRRCPTCGHCHPNGVGSSWCRCKDCRLLWTTVPRDLLAPAYLARLRELEQG